MTTSRVQQALEPDLSFHWVRFSTDDWTTVGTSQTINLGAALPTNAVVLKVSVQQVEVVAGSSLSAFVIDVGDTSDDDCHVDGLDIFGGTAGQRYEKPGARVAGTDSASQLKAIFTSTGCNLSALTAGQVDVVVVYQLLPAYDAD